MDDKKKTNWLLVYTANGPSEAIVIRSVLETNGIKVKEVQETAGKLWALTLDGLGKVEFFVPEEKFDEARALLESKEE
jgi:hypothetical protein